MKFDQLAEAFNVRLKSVRAATLKRLSNGKPTGLTQKQESSIPYLRRRGKEAGFKIERYESGKYVLKTA